MALCTVPSCFFCIFTMEKKRSRMQRRKLLHSSAQKGLWPQGDEGPHGLCVLIPTRGLEGLGAGTVPQLPLAWRPHQPHLPCPCPLAAGSAMGQQGKAVATNLSSCHCCSCSLFLPDGPQGHGQQESPLTVHSLMQKFKGTVHI